MLKDWKTCKNKYYFKYIKKIYIPQKEDTFELGKKVHALISYYLNGFDMSLMEKSVNDEILEHYHSILKHPFLKQKHFLSEWGFNVNVKDTDNLFVGRIDAIFYDEKNNKYSIADWKTGMKISQNPIIEPQAQIYLYAFFKAQKDLKINFKEDDLSFTFIQTPSLKESSINFSKELYQKFEDDFIMTINDIKKYKYEKEFEENQKCKYCEYKFMCQKN
ncbi:MAG: PD-(D/E)XK nuclease family protein [Candidatus Gastranaerophilales bacterium]|nr:PD-(D/E)XK nuclease family protein [Candidatus Gastranaerophilales bacterium]